MLDTQRILLKNAAEIEKMRIAGKLTAQVLEAVGELIVPGVTTREIDRFCHDFIIDTLDAIPGSLGQYGYPFTVNTSLNNVVCHGWPSEEVLKNGDIINVDVTVKKGGYYGDSSVTFFVGDVSPQARHLVTVTQECLYKAIKIVRPGTTLGDIGCIIQKHAETNHYSVVREFCGHGIGRSMHEEPQILHYGKAGKGLALKEGMTFTIEPMINQGKRDVRLHKDGWIVTTRDGLLSAQFEHTLLVTATGCEVLTLREDERAAFEKFMASDTSRL